MKTPKGWRTVGLVDILTGPQIVELHTILETSQDADEVLRRCRTMFSLIRDDLKAKNCDPDYLAYCVAYLIYQNRPYDDFSNN